MFAKCPRVAMRRMPADPDHDWAYELLSKARRRFVLAYLDATEPPVTVETLATAIADWEAEGDGPPSTEVYEAVECSLHHVHLPKLSDAGVVAYDRDALVVTDWYHPILGEAWVTDGPPVALAERLATGSH